jgi:hypothetical protein
VRIGEREFYELRGEKLFQYRLRPLELVFQREFNAGGYFPGTVDASQATAPMKRARGLKRIALHEQSDFPKTDLYGSLVSRRSNRSYAPRPLEKRKLGQFLQLTTQARTLVERCELATTSLRNCLSGGDRYPHRRLPIGGECSVAPQG